MAQSVERIIKNNSLIYFNKVLIIPSYLYNYPKKVLCIISIRAAAPNHRKASVISVPPDKNL